jgi:hypothetical protein
MGADAAGRLVRAVRRRAAGLRLEATMFVDEPGVADARGAARL